MKYKRVVLIYLDLLLVHVPTYCSGEILPQSIVYGFIYFDVSPIYFLALLITTSAETRKMGNTLFKYQHVEWYSYSKS